MNTSYILIYQSVYTIRWFKSCDLYLQKVYYEVFISLKNLKISFWRHTVQCAVPFSAEIGRQSEQEQALANFSNFGKFRRHNYSVE
jgi:hypothetical protein